MHKRYFPIAVVTGLLCIMAIAGYVIPQAPNTPPVRVLLDNKGGKVIFSHLSHNKSMNQECELCHHYHTDDTQHPPQCMACHVKKFDKVFKENHPRAMDQKLCGSCHHADSTIALFSHTDHVDDYVPDDCQACHHSPSTEPKPQACSKCHDQPGYEDMPSLMKASHSRCIECHEEYFKEDAGGCQRCHARNPAKEEIKHKACSKCHEEPLEALIPTTTAAFHIQCQTCHEYKGNGNGPYGENACHQCHMK